MERLCIEHERDRGLGCFVEMVQSEVGEYVRYEDASAEIANLRAEVDSLRAIEAAATAFVKAANEVDDEESTHDKGGDCNCTSAWDAYESAREALLKAVKP